MIFISITIKGAREKTEYAKKSDVNIQTVTWKHVSFSVGTGAVNVSCGSAEEHNQVMNVSFSINLPFRTVTIYDRSWPN